MKIKSIFFIIVIVLMGFKAKAQGYLIGGTTTVTLGTTYSYMLVDPSSNGINIINWSVTNGQVNQTYPYMNVAEITYSSSGSATVTANVYDYSYNVYYVTLAVTVSSGAPSTPSTPTIQSSNCGNTVLARGTPPSGVTWYWQSSSSGTSTSNSSSTITKTSNGTQYLRARNSSGTWSASSSSKSYTVNILPSTPATPTITNNCGNTVLTKGSAPNGITYYWQSSSSGTSTSNSSTTATRTSGNTYYLRARNNSTGCWSASRTVSYSITQPTTWYADGDGDGFGNSGVTASACSQPSNYVSNDDDYNDTTIHITNIAPQNFYADVDSDGFGDPNSSVYYSVMPLGYVTNNTDQCPTEQGTFNGCDYTPATFSDENYIYTRVYQEPMSSESEINQNSDISESITYFDGLGRPMQSIGIKAAPDKKDIITHIDYDAYGRQDKGWLPYHEITGSLGSYRGDKSLATQQYYQTNYADDFVGIPNMQDINAYSQKQLEASPLSRVEKQAAPGEDWKLGGGHEIGFEYQTNTFDSNNPTNTNNDNIRLYKTDLSFANNTYTPTLVLGSGVAGYYGAGELYKTITKDENHDGTSSKAHTTEEFKDKQRRVILKRTYGTSEVNNITQTNVAHDTYYVYDDYGNLTYVLPPKSEPQTAKPDATGLSELCYQYKYDHRNRLVEKKIPGKGWESIVYNKLDQPILTQDANLAAQNKWLFTKYDAFGRVAYTGEMSKTISRTALQDVVSGTVSQTVTKSDSSITIDNTTIYYNNGAYPVNDITEIHTINYYDNYTFDKATVLNLPLTSLGQTVINHDDTDKASTKGLTTGSKVRVLDTDNWITTITGYDVKRRAIYVASDNAYLVTTDVIKSSLDFVGKVTKTETEHTKGGTTITTVDMFTYDHVGRLLSQKQKINSLDEETIVTNTYDNLGQLTSKGVGGKTTQSRLQNVDYTYNVRGWLKQINNPITLSNDLFGFEIKYNDISDTTKKLFNGNISQTLWNTQSVNTSGNLEATQYTYTYDALNRITAATDNTGHYDLNSISYDKMGNITGLSRDGWQNTSNYTNMDNLVYTYDSGNKLQKVLDNGNDTYGFKDGVNQTTEFTYDLNGNLLTDVNKGITSILYNHLNMPTEIKLNNSNTQKINYTYTASGIKVKKVVNDRGNVTTTDYAGAYQYVNNDLKFINNIEDGYVYPKSGGGFGYTYYYTDQLDNIRLSYTDNDGNGVIDANTEIIKEAHFYPFGLKLEGFNTTVQPIGSSFHKYDYQNQERQDELGLNLLQFKYRMHDPEIGRFISIDPLAEDYTHNSTYAFAENKVIKYNELEGLEITLNKFDRLSYENTPDPRAKISTFVANAGVSILNGAIDVFNYVGDLDRANQSGQGAGNKVVSDASVVVEGVSDYAQNTTLSEFGADLKEVATNVETYENLAGALVSGAGVTKVSKFGSISKATNAVDDVVSSGAKTGGRLGNASTRAQNSAVGDNLVSRGYEIKGGGGRLPEEYLPPIGGGRKGGSYPDITATKDGRTLRINTVDTKANGSMTTREATNAARIRAQKPNDHLVTIPK